ncbi:MAG: hypothetical protein N2450_07250 [bacterium]|nr:hypothetical protein [bacterium]
MAKIELQIGEVEFECEGAESWVMRMYEKFLLDFLPRKGVAKPAQAPTPKATPEETPKPVTPKPKAEKSTEPKAKATKKKGKKKAKKLAAQPKIKKVKAATKTVKTAAAEPLTEEKALAPEAIKPSKPAKKKAPKKAKAAKPKAPKTKRGKKPAKVVAPSVTAPDVQPKGSMPPLAEFLKMNNANETLMKKFLVTAVWLHHNGKIRMRPNDINLALLEIGEGKFHRPTDSLKTNIKKGFCAREGDKFFITELGFKQVKV